MSSRARTTLVATAALTALLSIASSAQLPPQIGQIKRNSGDNVVPVYEGWEKNADGTFNLVFGYMNRNYQEEPEIPIGPNNFFSPGSQDQGQPTHFYPRRQQFMFKVKVPKVGDLQTELVHDFFEGFASGARANVHVKVLYGRSSHHHVEAVFKAFARALRVACSKDKRLARMLPSTKGLL